MSSIPTVKSESSFLYICLNVLARAAHVIVPRGTSQNSDG